MKNSKSNSSPKRLRIILAMVAYLLLSFFLVFIFLTPSKSKKIGADSAKKFIEKTYEKKRKALSSSKNQSSYARLPIRFERNQGQADPQVRYLSRGEGFTIFLTSNEAVLNLNPPNFLASKPGPSSIKGKIDQGEIETSVLRIKLVGANPDPKIVGVVESSGKSHYFFGKDSKNWQRNISNYHKVKYQKIYPGIDMVFHGRERRIEYDFVISPGTDPDTIRLEFSGVEAMEMGEGGRLLLRMKDGEIIQHKPTIYQYVRGKKKYVPGGYKLEGKNTVGFKMAAYDAKLPLIIDPILSYSTYLGGPQAEEGHGIAVDGAGNVFVTGFTPAGGFPSTWSSPGLATSGDSGNVFVTKINPGGTGIVYSAIFGGSGEDKGLAIALDEAGNAYVTGKTKSSDFPIVGSSSTKKGGVDAFVTKVGPTGSELIYSRLLGGNEVFPAEFGQGITVDSAGNAYVTGVTDALDFPLAPFPCSPPPKPPDFPLAPVEELKVLLEMEEGVFPEEDTQGANPLVPEAIPVDKVALPSCSFQRKLAGPHVPAGARQSDAFVTKLNSSGGILFSTYLGGSGSDSGNDIAVDSSGNVYVTGTAPYLSVDFPLKNALRHENENTEAFLTKFNPAGSSLVFSTFLGGAGMDLGWGLALDSTGNAYVTGSTSSTDFLALAPGEPPDPNCHGIGDVFVTKISFDGSHKLYSTCLGGTDGTQMGYGIAVDGGDRAWVAGYSGANNLPMVNAIYDHASTGQDAFVAQFNADGTGLLFSTYLPGDGPFDVARDIVLDSAGNAYVVGFTQSSNFPVSTPALDSSLGGSKDVFVTKIGRLAFKLPHPAGQAIVPEDELPPVLEESSSLPPLETEIKRKEEQRRPIWLNDRLQDLMQYFLNR